MGNHVTFSVIVPVYNTEKYLEDCLNSIVSQSVPFNEVILVNDGSTDSSRELCENYCRNNHSFTLINQQNLGQSAARNAGLQIATGNYIIFIDSDDYVQNDMAEKIGQELDKRNLDVLYYNASIKYELNAGESKSAFIRDEKYLNRDMSGKEYLMESFPANYIVSPCLAAYRREFLTEQKLWFPEGVYYEDNCYHLKVTLAAQHVRCISNAFYIRRCRVGSTITGIMTEKKCSDLIKINYLIWEELREHRIEKLFLISFISSNLLYVYNVIADFGGNVHICQEKRELLESFADNWMQLYLDSDLSLSDEAALLLVFVELGINRLLASDLRDKIRKSITERLAGLPLSDQNKKVGIYGIGKHTQWLLDFYSTYVGDITCDLYFIVTDPVQNKTNVQGIKPLGCDDIPIETDLIIISSLFYQRDMYKELIQRGIPDQLIKRLYNDDDICDLYGLWKIYTAAREEA